MGDKVYAVAVGRRVGLFERWDGPNGAQAQVNGFPGARHQSFTSAEAAAKWLAAQGVAVLAVAGDEDDLFDPLPAAVPEPPREPPVARGVPAAPGPPPPLPADAPQIAVHLHSEGPENGVGDGAFAVLLLHDGREVEIAGAHAETTRRRQLVRALAEALDFLKCRCRVTVHAPDDYVAAGLVNLPYWRAHNWDTADGWPVQHADQWARIAKVLDSHVLTFAPAAAVHAERLQSLARVALAAERPRDYAHPPWQEAAPE